MKQFSYVLLIFVTSLIVGCAATVVGAGVGTVAATTTDDRGFKTVIADQDLEHKVNNVLSAQVPNGSFTIASYDSQVLVAGQVANENDYDKINQAVNNTNGVKKFWNYVSVSPKETIGAVSKDTYITSIAKTRLIGQNGVNANNIKVVTCSGVVYLLGRNAGEKYQIKGAISGIKQIDGVKAVINLIK
ncbi:MAG: BON domain-containing protein [Burkholderiales bacterium]|nr:BON domain-containing protein [Burkholderiales bacterium]